MRLLCLITMVGLAGCAGVSVAVPVGGVTIGTTIMSDGGVAVGAASRAGRSVGMAGHTRAQTPFADVQADEDDASANAKDEKEKASADAASSRSGNDARGKTEGAHGD